MAALTPAQIAGAAHAAGLRDPANLAVAVAIAMAESGGNPQAHNATPPDNSYGLWQINMLGGMGPTRRAQLGITTNEALYDPAVNARAMMVISSQGRFWTPWTTFTRGAYLRHLAQGRAAAQAVLGSAAGGSAGGGAGGGGGGSADLTPVVNNPLIPDFLEAPATSAVDAAGKAISLGAAAAAWMGDRHNWLRVAYVGYGGLMLGAALLMAARRPLGVIGSAVPVGRAVKAVKGAAKAAA